MEKIPSIILVIALLIVVREGFQQRDILTPWHVYGFLIRLLVTGVAYLSTDSYLFTTLIAFVLWIAYNISCSLGRKQKWYYVSKSGIDGVIRKVFFFVNFDQKTKVTVVIPVHDFVQEIFDKYQGNIASGLTTQHFNRYLKKLTQEMGFTDKITFSYTRGSSLVTETHEEWELISSHTARRSFATNMVLQGVPTYQIMSITGHTTEKSFFRYMRLTKDNISKQIAGNNFFRK